MSEKTTNELTMQELIDDWYEYNPNLYSVQEIDCADLTANNVCEMLREEMNDYTNRIMLEFGAKLEETDTKHIFCMICHYMWAEIDRIEKYYSDECDKTRDAILNKMAKEYYDKEYESREPDPCEVPDYEGNYKCPFDSNGTDDCRRHCGVGVDE